MKLKTVKYSYLPTWIKLFVATIACLHCKSRNIVGTRTLATAYKKYNETLNL